MKRRRFSYLVCCLLACLTVVGPQTAWPEEWRVGIWETAQTIQPFFFQKFTPAQVKVLISTFTNPADQKAALLAGKLDMCGTTMVNAIQAASRHEPVVLVASLCNKCSALVVGRQSSIQNVKDLVGKKIGYPAGTMHEILLRETLMKNGLNPAKDVKMIPVDFFNMGLALAQGKVDAFLSGEPYPAEAVAQGYGRILAYPYYKDAIGTINGGLLVRRQSIQEHPELIYQMVAAHARATQYLRANQEEWLQRAADFGTPWAILRLAASNIELAWDLDENFVTRLQTLGNRLEALGLIEHQPDYSRLIDTTFVDRYRANQKGSLAY